MTGSDPPDPGTREKPDEQPEPSPSLRS